MSFPLPIAVVEIVEGREFLTHHSASRSDRSAGRNAALQRTCINYGRLPGARNAFGRRPRLSDSQFAEWHVLSAAKALRRNAIDVTMTSKNDLSGQVR